MAVAPRTVDAKKVDTMSREKMSWLAVHRLRSVTRRSPALNIRAKRPSLPSTSRDRPIDCTCGSNVPVPRATKA